MADRKSEEGMPPLPEMGDSLDVATFEQILEMDDDEDDREFSRSIVYGFFEQAENTFTKMSEGLKAKDLKELSQLGHFLKGSSATLGLTHMKNSCEKIQHLGHGKDEAGNEDKDEDYCLAQIKVEVAGLKSEYDYIKEKLHKFFESLKGSASAA